MEISFRTKIGLQSVMVVLGVLSVIYSYFGIIIGVVGFVLVFYEVRARGEERDDLRRKIVRETLGITDHIVTSTNASRILYPDWSSKSEGFKADILGKGDYRLCKQFYDAVEDRNQHYVGKEALGPWEDFEKLNRAICDAFFKIHDKISWVKESIPQATITELLSTAKRSACV